MLTMNNKEQILISNTNFLNNYDKENFISVSNNVLNKGNHLSIIDIEALNNQFDYLKSSLDQIDIHCSRDLIIYFNNISCIERINNLSFKMVSVLNLNNGITIKPQYLLEASNEIKNTVNKIISGQLDAKEFYVKYHASIDSYETLLKQQVINGINEYDNAESLFNKKYMDIEDNSLVVSVNYDCIKNEVIPFINNFQTIKSNIGKEISTTSSIVNQVLNNINLTIVTINKNTNSINNETFKLISNYTYNYIRFIIDIAYTVLYILSSKCYLLERITASITRLHAILDNEFHYCKDLIDCGIFDKIVTESESKKISDRLLQGNNNIFTEAVRDIMTYHNGYILSQVYGDDIPEIDNDDFISVVANRYDDYDKTTIESVIEIYDNINRGLDIIENNLDNEFLVVDKLIRESGFDEPLSDQYGYTIEMVPDVNDYYDFSSSDIYFNLIGEISNYNENTSIIADAAYNIMTKIANIKESVNNMDDCFTKNELKTITESVEEQFISINKDVATNSYSRLKMLANKADYVLNGYYESTDYPEIIIGDDNDDFYRECFLNACLEELHDNNDILMESMLKGYYSEREYLEKGIRIVFEDGETNGSTNTSTNNSTTSSPSVNTNTSAGVVSDQNTNNAQNFEKLSVKIKKIIEKIINAFRDFINKYKKKNLEWLNKHKSELINRSYSNVSINVLPYHVEMPETQIFNYYNTMEKNVEKVAKDINKITSREDMRNKLFNFGNIKFEGENVDESKVLTNFFKVGNKALNVVTYSNKEVKTLVVDTMIPYCERYYNTLADEVAKYSEKLVAISSKYDTNNATAQTQTESVMITEAEGENQNAQSSATQQQTQTPQTSTPASQPVTNNNDNQNSKNDDKKDNKTPKYSEQYTWLSGFISDFVGSVCNATRARNDDYIKILAALVPKKQVFKNREGMDDNSQQNVSADNNQQS